MQVNPLSRWFTYALGLFAIAFVFEVMSQRYLFADGANFFLQVATSQTFSHWDYPRQFAHYLTQWPIVLAISLGVRNLPALSTLYGVGLFMWPLLALAACDWLSPTNQRALLVFPVFGFAYTGLNSALFIISESHAAAACFWIILFYLFFMPRGRGKQWLVSFVALAATRMYESYAFLGLFLAGLALFQLYRSLTHNGRTGELATLIWIAVCMLIASGIGFYWMLIPVDRNVQTIGLGKIILGLLQDPNTRLSTALMVFFVSTFFPGRHHPRSITTVNALFTGAIVLGALLGTLTLVSRSFVPVVQQYPARILNIAVPLTFAVLMLWVRRQGPRRPYPTRWMLVPVFAMVVWNTTWQTTVSGQWQAYADSLQQVVQARHGVVELQATPLKDQPFNWDWSMPCLSIVVESFKDKSVPSLVRDGMPKWQPFDPQQADELPDLQAYGVTYGWLQPPQGAPQPSGT